MPTLPIVISVIRGWTWDIRKSIIADLVVKGFAENVQITNVPFPNEAGEQKRPCVFVKIAMAL